MMKTNIYELEDLEVVANTVREGGFVAIKTDTVYGLAASSHDDELYEKLQMVKERPADKPFPLMVSSLEQIESVADVTELQRHLMHTFMPGAVTFIFKRKPDVFQFLKDQDTLGIRMADDPWVQAMITKVGNPIWLPSANRSGFPTATSSHMVLEQLDGKIDGVINGEISGGISSSVFDLTGDKIVCLREGIVTLEAVQKEAEQWKK
ncbi:L-threonylcarbamoyladenylate synthase [Erysipelothrix aquatica]|uniref:L-threonylcarbamoyladenylate synthase n=1 Tax=Erysipelothrix aquatica TaxID=2683714 RepID=UPI001F2E66BB|nr:L-threonylcarbamoyladenylate synthase [Erysipelothrix aquatica]